jgi:PAT family beta-lactamase induction signal transducer AmpG
MQAERQMEPVARRGWRAACRDYLNRRQLAILLMGFSSGLPLLLTLSTLSYWLSKVGIDKTSIGLFALVGLPYAFKFVWAPLLDHTRLPLLAGILGHRRSWALVIQVLLMAAILAMGLSDPASDPWPTALAALFVAFFSASQDIVIDAYRIEILSEEEQGAGAAVTQTGYRLALIAAGAGAIALSDFVDWPTIFACLAALILVGVLGVLLAPEPEVARTPSRELRAHWLRVSVVEPFTDFMTRRGWVAILVFALLYKFGDAIGGVMAYPLYVDLDFTGLEIAAVSKVFGVLITVAGGITGGLLVSRYGYFPALLAGGILQAVTNLLYAVLALHGHDLTMLVVAIGADNFTGGMGSAAFVAYLSALCNKRFTGTQFALLTSLMAAGRTLLSSGGGWLADQMDWVSFFVATTALAIPGLLLLLWLRRVNLGLPEDEAEAMAPPAEHARP